MLGSPSSFKTSKENMGPKTTLFESTKPLKTIENPKQQCLNPQKILGKIWVPKQHSLNPSSSSSTDPPPENNQQIQQHEAPKNPNKIWMPKLQSLNSPLSPPEQTNQLSIPPPCNQAASLQKPSTFSKS